MLKQTYSQHLFTKGSRTLVGSVNSPVRSFKAVRTGIIFARKARGAYLWDVDENKYIDYIMSWGVHLFGHAYAPIVAAAHAAIKNSSSFGLASEQEIQLAAAIARHIKSIDALRFVNSGTEACMTAVRLARAFSGKEKIIKFDGCYHGHFDSLLVKSGSGNLTFGSAGCRGILPAYARDTISIPFNDIEKLKEAIEKNKHSIACIILEPVPCNAGVILPKAGYLKALEKIAKQENIILIFDEVITGFRLSLSAAQGLFGITPDLTCLGKIIGGGFPIGAVGGRREIMELLSPQGPVYQAGTFSGNPVSIAAGLAVFKCLEADPNFYKDLEKKATRLVSAIKDAAVSCGISLTVNAIGSVFSVFFTDKSVRSYADTQLADTASYARLFSALFQEGILFPPSAFEACFISGAHSQPVIEKTAQAFKKVLRSINPFCQTARLRRAR